MVANTSQELVVRATGDVVNLASADECANTIRALRDLKRELDETIAVLTDALLQVSEREGTKTLHLSAATVTVKGGTITLYDADAIEHDLLEAGMSETRIRQIVKEEVTVTRKVMAGEAKRAAQANQLYGEIIERHSTIIATTPSVTVK